MDKQTQLDALRDEIIAHDICKHMRETATQLVMGAGNPDADIVLIGEAPGKQEDEQGLPFVGASGKFLDEMLAAADMNRDDIYITNIVKYRPPNNRDPAPEEKQAFWPYLMRQLEIIDPRVIITLGRHSGSAFVPDLKISRDHGHGRTLRYRRQAGLHDKAIGSADEQAVVTWLVVPLYHPAAALYNGGMRQALLDDFVAAAELVRAK